MKYMKYLSECPGRLSEANRRITEQDVSVLYKSKSTLQKSDGNNAKAPLTALTDGKSYAYSKATVLILVVNLNASLDAWAQPPGDMAGTSASRRRSCEKRRKDWSKDIKSTPAS
ncbi:hypothetical protein F4803DRAFT_546298 [Xylaria telfairii]|nr:hypothetical protein F4803DRAFT_546298 [Xylaria telfairii]